MRADTASSPPVAEPTVYGSRVALGACFYGPKPEAGILAPIIAALTSSVISQGVNRISSTLSAAAKEETKWADASRNIEVSGAAFGPCLQVVRGWFYLSPLPLTDFDTHPKFAEARTWLGNSAINEDQYSSLWKNNIWLAAPPDFLFEGHIAASDTGNALTVVPQYARLDEPLFNRSFRNERSRFVSVFFAFGTPNSPVDVKTSPAATIILGRLEPGKAQTFPPIDVLKPLPSPARSAFNRWPHESDWFTLSLTEKSEPLTVSARVSETQGANAFLEFLSSVFDDSKETIAAQLQIAASSEARMKAREAETDAANKIKSNREDAQATFFENRIAAIDALSVCEKGGGNPQKQIIEVLKALNLANQSARNAREDDPVSQSCIETIQSAILRSEAEVQAACSSVYQRMSVEPFTCQ